MRIIFHTQEPILGREACTDQLLMSRHADILRALLNAIQPGVLRRIASELGYDMEVTDEDRTEHYHQCELAKMIGDGPEDNPV